MVSGRGGSPKGPRQRRSRSKSSTIDLTASEVRAGKAAEDTAEPESVAVTPPDAAGATASRIAEEHVNPISGEPDPVPPVGEETKREDTSEFTDQQTNPIPGVLDPDENTADAEQTGISEAAAVGTDAPAPPLEPSAGLEPMASADEPVPEDRPSTAAAAGADEKRATGEPAQSYVRQKPQRRSSATSSLIAAAIGGLVVLAGGAALIAGGMLPVGGADTTAEIQALDGRIGELDQRIGSMPTVDLANRVDALENTVGSAGASQDLAAEVERLGSRVDQLASASAEGGDTSSLEEQIATLTSQVQALGEQANAAASGDIGTRFDALEASVGDLRSTVAGLTETVTQLRDDLSGLTDAASARDTSLANITARLDTIDERLDAGPKGGEIAALFLAVTTLASKISDGEPFAADLSVVRTAAPDIEGLDDLAATAESGVPTVEELAASFPAEAILATRVPPLDAGIVDRLFAGAKSVVNYRETGTETEDSTSAAVSSIESALAAGDLQTAKAAVADLPEAARRVADGWTADLDRRIAADAVVANLTDRILMRLQAPAEGQ